MVVARADGVSSTAEPTLTPTGGVDQLDGARIVRKAGVMGVVERGGDIRAGQRIDVVLPDYAHTALEPV